MKQVILVLVAALCISATKSQSVAKTAIVALDKVIFSSSPHQTLTTVNPVFSDAQPRGSTAHCADESWSISEHVN